MRDLARLASISIALLLGSPAGRATAQAAPCPALGNALTEHTCFHARFGPFAARTATVGSTITDATPNVDPVHTYYRIALTPGRPGTVAYTPKRSGSWAFFVVPEVGFAVRDSSGSVVTLQRVPSDGSCPFLGDAQVATVTANERYAITFPASTTSEVTLVIEKIDDFVRLQGRDMDGDGFGDPDDVVVDACTTRPGYAPNDYDCDDTDPDVHPDAQEICDGVDGDCDGNPDDVGSPCAVGLGACAETGTSSCPNAGQPAVCSAVPGAPAADDACNGEDDDCDGSTDEDGDLLCSADSSTPACVSTGLSFTCGCFSDADCGGPTSARLCFLHETTQRCIAGCIDAFGRNGCPAGEQCTSSNPATPGTCVPSGSIVDAGAGDDAGSPDESDAGPIDAGTAVPPPAGCTCSAGGDPDPRSGSAGLVGALVGLTLLARRTRRRAAVAIGATFFALGCYSTQLPLPDELPDASTPDADAPDGSVACVPELGESLVDHACQHAGLGPFEDVVATPDGEIPPEVSTSHHTYEVDLRFGANVRYRPSRDGSHVVFVDPGVGLGVHEEGRGDAVEAHETLAFECPELTTAYEVHLRAGLAYELTFATTEDAVALFIEHPSTFGDEAWKRTCP